ncbi:MAG: ABC transporter permease subunit [Burkholderiales bacterium]|nr:ABC transporter permease subunit [Burkholderiales bacterium]
MSFDFGEIVNNRVYLLEGLSYSVKLTGFAMTIGIIVGCLLAMARLSSIKPLSLAASGYVNLFRSLPLVLVIYWFYILAPLLYGEAVGADRSAYITFSVFEAAYYCEIIRAGIQSVSRGQIGAGQAVGFTYWQNMRFVVLPQAFRNVLPLLLLQTIILFQDTSLVYVVGAKDFLGMADTIGHRDSALKEMYSFVAVSYLVISFILSTLVKKLHQRIAVIR